MAVAAHSLRGETQNRGRAVLDTAARLFAERGYDGTSMRDIAAAVGLRPSSLYYFYASKEALFVAVYEAGVDNILHAVRGSLAPGERPWAQLRVACAAHLGSLLAGDAYARVVVLPLPGRGDELRDRLVSLRDRYERLFESLIAALPLDDRANRRYLRLTLLGALNAVPGWYQPDGDSPDTIAGRILDLMHKPLEPEAP